jgi:hypothetical protein
MDAVESFRDDHVRDARKKLVRRVENELEAFEEMEMWRRKSEPVVVESVSAAVESILFTVEFTSAPALVEVEPIPAPAKSVAAQVAVGSTSVSVAVGVPALPTTIDPVKPRAWLAARLAQPSESEDSEAKTVREGLTTRLAERVMAPSEPSMVEQPESQAVESSGDVSVKL